MKLKIVVKTMRLSVRVGGGRTMPDVFSMYRNDLEPAFELELYNYNSDTAVETAMDLSDPDIVVGFRTRPLTGGPLRVDSAFTPVDASKGKFIYYWQTNDTLVADKFLAEVTITYPGTPTTRSRTVRQFELHVLEDLP